MSELLELFKTYVKDSLLPPTKHEYDAVYVSISFDDDCQQLFDTLLNYCEPTKLLYISIDGVLPLALIKKRKNKEKSNNNIKEFVSKYINSHPLLTVILSDETVPGSSSQKIIEYIRKQSECLDFPETMTHCFITNKDIHFFFSLHLALSVIHYPKGKVMFDVLPTMFKLIESFNLKTDTYEEKIRILDDIVSLSVLSKNDVVPQMSQMSLLILLKEYSNFKKSNEYISYFGYLNVELICQMLKNYIEAKDKSNIKQDEDKEIDAKQSVNEMNDIIANKIRKELLLLKNKLKDEEYNCSEYWKGISWCCQTFFQKCPDWEWFFQFSKPPSIEELANSSKINNYLFTTGRPIHPELFNILVSPKITPFLNENVKLKEVVDKNKEYYEDQDSMNIIPFVEAFSKINIQQCTMLGQNKLLSLTNYDTGTLFNIKNNHDTISQLNVIDKKTFFSYPNNCLEGTVVNKEEHNKIFYYDLVEPWYSNDYIFMYISLNTSCEIFEIRKRKTNNE